MYNGADYGYQGFNYQSAVGWQPNDPQWAMGYDSTPSSFIVADPLSASPFFADDAQMYGQPFQPQWEASAQSAAQYSQVSPYSQRYQAVGQARAASSRTPHAKSKSRKRQGLVTHRDSYRQHAIERIPGELWQEIMALCVPSPSISDEKRGPRNITTCHALATLSQISGGLRNVALGTPHLWTTLFFAPWGYVGFPKERYLKHILSLSKGLPLFICLEGISNSTLERGRGLFLKLTSEIQRWKELSVDMEFTSGAIKSLHTPRMLQSLAVRGAAALVGVTPSIDFLLKNASSLVRFYWIVENSLGSARRSCNLALKSKRLSGRVMTTLTIDAHLGVIEALHLLKHTPQLVTLKLNGLHSEPHSFTEETSPSDPPTSKGGLQLRRLRSLQLRSSHWRQSPMLLLEYLYTPALTSLALNNMAWNRSNFSSWATLSRFLLSSLELTAVDMPSHEFQHILEAPTCARLKSLRVDAVHYTERRPCPFTASVLRAMTPSRNGYLVPFLEDLTVTVSSVVEVDGSGLFPEMVKTRCKAQPRYLRSVVFDRRLENWMSSKGVQDSQLLERTARRYGLQYTVQNFVMPQ